jgi:hypothetical protein
MKSMIPCLLAVALSVAVVLGWSSTSVAADPETGLEVCGHLDEMAEARQALVEGDKDRALEYLRAARAILVECERKAEIASDPEPKLKPGRDLI